MMGLVVKLVLGIVLFVGSLVGGLAATGRLNHDGTANIPGLSSFFPAPPAPAEGDKPADAAGESDHGKAATPGATDKPNAADASPSGGSQDPQADAAPHRQKTGRSLGEPEKAAGGEAAGHGEVAKDEHGKDAANGASKQDHAKPVAAADHGRAGAGTDAAGSLPEADFHYLEHALASGKSQYTPGDLFRFQGLPAGVSADQINDAWQRVQGMLQDIENRKVVLDQQEQQLHELGEDISRRQAALGKERVEIEQMHRQLDAKIQKFHEQVKLVRSDEVAALKRNAQTIASWERDKAVQLVEAQWKSDKGQDEILKLIEFMDKDAVNEILAALPLPIANEILKKRLRVSKEPAAPGKPD